MKRNKAKLYFSILIFSFSCLLSTVILVDKDFKYNTLVAYNDNVSGAVPTIETTTSTTEVETTAATTKTTTTRINTTKETTTTTSPVKGYLKIDDFKVDIVKDDSSYYYLNHGLDGKKDGIGVPFVDFRQNFYTRKTIIYGHSFSNKNGPFQYLQNYHNNKAFYDQHKYIEVVYKDKYYKYEIFSVYVSLSNNDDDEGLEYFRENDYTGDSWLERLNIYKNNSEYDTGVEVQKFDRILILQTCSMDPNYREKYYRYNLLIMGRLI